MASAASALAVSYAAYVLGGSAAAFHTPRAGAVGLVGACLVGVAQAAPDREITLMQTWKLRMKHVPAAYLAAASLVAPAVGRGAATLPLAFGGAAAGWAYLRHFQAKDNGAR